MSRRRRRFLPALILIVFLLALAVSATGIYIVRRPFPETDGTIRLPGLQAQVEVYRDSLGVPHIYASNLHDLMMAQGFVHAQDRFWQMEFSRRIGSGRLAEVLGPTALESDRFIRTLGWHRTAAQELEQLDGETRAALEAYAEGVNAYISSRAPGALGLEFTVLGLTGVRYTPEPWTILNTITWGKVMAWDLSGNMTDELLRAQIAAFRGPAAVSILVPPYPSSYPVIVAQGLGGATLEAVPDAAFSAGRLLGIGDELGSNNWVIAGSRTESGAPLLANDPHLGIQMPSIWYEIGLHCDPVGPECPIEAVGVSFPGAPGVIIGHNQHIAWGATNLNPDVQDLFVERLNPDNPNQYEFQGAWLDMELVREEIRVAGEEEPVVMFARLTRHGPIINDVMGGPEEEWSYGWQPLALSWTALQPGSIMRSILLLDQATNWDEFHEALRIWDVAGQNFVYADTEGNIGYQGTGRVPIRAQGDGSMPVPGWSGEYEWIDTIPYDSMPREFNPEEGYIVTANNAVVGPDFPYFLSMDWDPGYRARRIIALIEADPTLSIGDIQAIQGDSTPLWAQDVLPFVTGLTATEARLNDGLTLLRGWNGIADRGSAGAALFESFSLHLVDRTFGDELGQRLLRRGYSVLMTALENLMPSPASPWFDDISTAEVEGRDAIILLALQDAIDELSETLGGNMSRWRWGDLHTATFESQSLGQSGIGLIEALFNRGPVEVDGATGTINNTAYDLDEPYDVTVVPSYRQVIDLGDFTRSVSMHTTGQSGHPFHRHYADMIDHWRNIEYAPMLWSFSDVERAAEAHLTLVP